MYARGHYYFPPTTGARAYQHFVLLLIISLPLLSRIDFCNLLYISSYIFHDIKTRMVKELAFFKIGPSKTAPCRPGPIQCVRNCSTCIIEPLLEDDPEVEDILSVKSYDDLIYRQSLRFAPYQKIQYHLGQIDLLKRSLDKIKPRLVLYVVAVSRLEDSNYLNQVLDRERLPPRTILTINPTESINSDGGHFIVPISMRNCPIEGGAVRREVFKVREVRDLIEPLVAELEDNRKTEEQDLRVVVVPVAISKDHDKSGGILGIGSLCIQVIEPYSLREYIRLLKTEHKTGHLVQHLYYDLALNGARLPSHIVAFLLLNLDRPFGVSHEDLIEFMDWMRKSSMEFNLHMAFTGDSDRAVEFALIVLNDYIKVDKVNKIYRAVNIAALIDYANCILPNIVYYGIICRAALMLNNRDAKNTVQVKYSPDFVIKVMKDDLLQLSQDLAESIDTSLPCRRPCADVQTCIVEVFERMQTFGHYFRIHEARIRQSAGRAWAGDYDSDDEYFWSRRDDPAFKPWVIMTQRPYRLDRLNLLMNAVEPYLVGTDVDES